jgi:hypothetical protein
MTCDVIGVFRIAVVVQIACPGIVSVEGKPSPAQDQLTWSISSSRSCGKSHSAAVLAKRASGSGAFNRGRTGLGGGTGTGRRCRGTRNSVTCDNRKQCSRDLRKKGRFWPRAKEKLRTTLSATAGRTLPTARYEPPLPKSGSRMRSVAGRTAHRRSYIRWNAYAAATL